MQPFTSYPGQGRKLLGKVVGSNCRHGYGLKFMRVTGQTKCAYCGHDFTVSYENWLQMALDHVVPRSVCGSLRLHDDWVEDCSNKVLACGACNSFFNRYKPSWEFDCPDTLDAFYDLRDRIFEDRKRPILQKHKDERAFFARRAWEQSVNR